MQKNPMPSPSQVYRKETLNDILGGLAFIATALALLLVFLTSGCDDDNQTARPSCGIHDLTRYVLKVAEVRQHCVVTQHAKGDVQKRTCNDGNTKLSVEGSPVMFETTISGRLLAVRIDPPGGGARVGQAHKAKDGLNWTATIVAADEALFSRAQVDDTVALCPWQDQKYAYELPDMGMLSKLWEEEPSSMAKGELQFPSTIEDDTPTCDQPPCEGEGEGAMLKPPLAASTRFLTKSGLPLAESIDEK